jgi:hypothetical protein
MLSAAKRDVAEIREKHRAGSASARRRSPPSDFELPSCGRQLPMSRGESIAVRASVIAGGRAGFPELML